MEITVTVTIKLTGLPDQPNHHPLAQRLASDIDFAVATAVAETYNGAHGKDWSIHISPI